MKKTLVLFFMSALLFTMLIFAAPQSADAQTYLRRVVRNGRVTWVRTAKPSYYRRHRNRINMAVGTGAGVARKVTHYTSTKLRIRQLRHALPEPVGSSRT